MRVLATEFGQVTWLIDVSLPRGQLYMPDVVAKAEARYGFVRSPNPQDLLEPPNTTPVFEHGKFGEHVIRKMSVHGDGLIAESKGGTDVAEKFLRDLVSWLEDEYELQVLDINKDRKIYDSTLIVQMDFDIGKHLQPLQSVASDITKCLSKYEDKKEEYSPVGITFDAERERGDPFVSRTFVLERRNQQPFKSNVYFSSAPLKTEDHIKVLEALELLPA